MVSLTSQVRLAYDNDNDITLLDLKNIFPKENEKSLSNRLRELQNKTDNPDIIIGKVNLDGIEPLILKALNKTPNGFNIKLALDFIRLKQSTEGLQDDIDIEQYLKKVEAITGCQDKVDKNEKELDIPEGYISRGKLIYDTMTSQEEVDNE